MSREISPVAPRPAVIFAMLAVLTLGPFVAAIPGQFLWDDVLLVSGNAHLRDADYLSQAVVHPFPYAELRSSDEALPGLYRPVISVAYGVEFRLFGQNPVGYHLVNLALHLACVLLAFFWLRRRIGTVAGSTAPGIAAAAGALVFAVHPSRVESVAWISGCSDLWMALFVLLGLIAWDLLQGVPGAIVAATAFALAMLCKELAVVVPVMVAVDAFLLEKPGEPRRSRSTIGLVVVLPALAFWLRTHWFPLGSHNGLDEPLAIMAKRVIAAAGGYARMVLFPWPASTQTGYLDPHAAPGTFPIASLAAGAILFASVLVLVVLGWRSPARRPWLADVLWCTLLMLPVLVSISDNYYVNERHLYLPMLGEAALAARFLRTRSAASSSNWLAAAGVLIVAFLAGTAAHAAHFASSDALWSYEVRLRPDDAQVLEALKTVRMQQGRFVEAKALARRTLKALGPSARRAPVFNDWLEADLRQSQSSDALLGESRMAAGRIAAGERPAGPAGEAYDLLSERDRLELLQSREFQICHARLLWATGDAATSERMLDAITQQYPPNRVERDDVTPLVAELVADGKVDEATQRLAVATPTMDPGRMKVTTLLAAARSLPVGPNPKLAAALMAADQPFEAFSVLQKVPRENENEDDTVDRIIVETTIRRYKEALADAERLRKVDPGKSEEFLKVVQSLMAEDGVNSEAVDG